MSKHTITSSRHAAWLEPIWPSRDYPGQIRDQPIHSVPIPSVAVECDLEGEMGPLQGPPAASQPS